MRHRFRWSLVLAIVFGGTAIVIAAAAWGGTPAKQLPFIAASTIVGAFLPAVAGRAGERRPNAEPKPSAPTPAVTRPTAPREQTMFTCGIPPMPQEERPKRRYLAWLIGLAGLLLILMAVNSLNDSGWGAVVCAIGVFACLFAIPFVFYEDAIAGTDITISIDSNGITLAHKQLILSSGSVTIAWEDISGFRFDSADGYVHVTVSQLSKGQFEVWHRILGHGKAYRLRETRWRSDRDTLPLVKARWLTSTAAGFYDALERHSGLPVTGR